MSGARMMERSTAAFGNEMLGYRLDDEDASPKDSMM
jgi:hypothetical protein